MRRRHLAAALLPLLLAAGCMSAEKRLEQGMKLENRGQPAEAARRYIDALRRDPSLVDARARLAETGAEAVEMYLAEARTGRPEQGADALLRLDALRADAGAVGVTLAVPPNYAQYHREMMDGAIGAAIDESRGMSASGSFSEAIGRLERAADRYRPTPEQREALDRGRVELFVAWAGGEMERGRYRAAFDVSERALRAFSRDFPGAEELRAVRAEALERGTVRVAVLPVTTDADVGTELPSDFLRALDDELEQGAWTEPPFFVALVDPAEVRRELRRRGNPRPGSGGLGLQAARLGEAVGADLVLVASIDSASVTERDVRTERRTARTTAGADTAFTLRSGRRHAWARVTYTLVDTRDRRSAERHTVTAESEVRFRRGEYAGSASSLNLSRDDRALFDARRRDEQERELFQALSHEISERLARDAFERVVRLVD
ncbi:MAG TPA: hypothetical protein VNP72_09230 [Longimicrobium sp.]|nr:hypothetical protein [Longimicrobium sp.]